MKLSDLKADPKNPRTITPQALKALGVSLEEFGDLSGITWNKRTKQLVCGHQRLQALKKDHNNTLKMNNSVIITPKGEKFRVRVVDWPKKKQRLANMVANSPEVAGWFTEDAAGVLEDLRADFPELSRDLLLEELQDCLGCADVGPSDGLTDPDDVPADVKPRAKLGDLWALGEHRLLCGDSANKEDVDRLLSGADIHLVNTDPPYNVKVEPRSNNAIAKGLSSFKGTHHQKLDVSKRPGAAKATTKKMRAKDRPLINDFLRDEEFEKLLLAWFGNMADALVPGGGFYIWGGYANCGNYPPALKATDLYFSQTIIWIKEHPVLTRKDFMGNHEWCFYGWKKGAAHRFFGPKNVYDTWLVKKINPQSMIHLTEKPVELASRAIEYSSKKGENILDLFGGSGSTLIGCEQSRRHAYLMEMDPLYCDVIVQRWENFTGEKGRRI